MALVGLLLGLTMVNLRPQSQRTRSQAMAYEVAQELRSARERALASGSPVAVVFPSSGGSQPHSQSYSILAGHDLPQTLKTVNFGTQYENTSVFVGLWSLTGGLANRRDAMAPWSRPSMLDLDRWLPAAVKTDYCLVFAPDGTVRTNDLPSFGGSVHLLVVNGAEYSGSSAPPGAASVTPGPSYFQPNRVGSPWTVAVSQAGSVSVRRGVQSASAVTEVDKLDFVAVPVRQTFPGLGPNQVPVLTSVEFFPALNPLTTPAGADATVAQDGHLTLVVRATDPDGDALFCNWTASGGALSSPAQDRMQFDVANQAWTSVWQWRPPEGAPATARFDLEYRVFDARGQVAGPLGAAVRTVEVLPRGRVLFTRDDAGGQGDVWVMNGDGTGLLNLTKTPNVDETVESASPDGSWLVYKHGSPSNLYRMYLDGTDQRTIGADVNWDLGGSISPDGLMVTRVWEPNFPGWELWIMNADGSNPVFVASQQYQGPNGNSGSSWSPDGTRLVYNKRVGGTWEVYTVNRDSSSDTALAVGPGNSDDVHWSRDDWIYFVSDRNGNKDIFRVRPDGSNLLQLTSSPNDETLPTTSPDGALMLFRMSGDLFSMQTDGTNLRRLTQTPEREGRSVWLP